VREGKGIRRDERSYQFSIQSRIGLRFAHISNADIHESNQGEDELLHTYAIRF
jgi:hypothetical protein